MSPPSSRSSSRNGLPASGRFRPSAAAAHHCSGCGDVPSAHQDRAFRSSVVGTAFDEALQGRAQLRQVSQSFIHLSKVTQGDLAHVGTAAVRAAFSIRRSRQSCSENPVAARDQEFQPPDLLRAEPAIAVRPALRRHEADLFQVTDTAASAPASIKNIDQTPSRHARRIARSIPCRGSGASPQVEPRRAPGRLCCHCPRDRLRARPTLLVMPRS